MNRSFVSLLIILVCCVCTGCGTSSTGLIRLRTQPRDATVFVNNTKRGTTPLTFEYDLEKPAKLRIEKEGYYPEEEMLSTQWIIKEHKKGNFFKGYYTIQGKRTKSWEVATIRKLGIIHPAPGAVQAESQTKGLKERLIELEELKAQGLISEEEYQAKRKQIIETY